jgi:hypothetical protein
MDKDEMLTIQEAAIRAGVTEQAIRNAIYRGKLAVTEKYGRKLIRDTEFEEYRKNTKMGRPPKEN